MDPLKIAIFDEIRKKDLSYVNKTYDEMNRDMFKHLDGYRLLLTGFVSVKKIFTAYSFEVPITMKAKHYIGLSRIAYPYFITSKRLVLFSEADSIMVVLSGGIQPFLENCVTQHE